MIARLEVTRGSLTEYPLAEKVCGGWQNGVMFYPDAEVTKVTPLIFRNETPTDDDQDALAQIVCRALEHQDGGEECEVDFAAADAILAGGFRRSVVPEPSAEGPAFIAIMPPSPETEKRWYSMYCRVCGVEEMMADAPDDPRLVARREEHNREHHAEPQGEPSDSVDSPGI